ncbi:MAG TPA: hypothetical protein VNN10_09895 [Dehalococcoidia bacterium]|nr:hypothetical protein [Dehalococcoidia bacterium]
MFNWLEAEALAWMRQHEVERGLIQAVWIAELREPEAARRPLRSRLASLLVRLGARLDPAAVAASDADALTEGRLAAYLR